jgi:hypothetical protein
LRNENHPEVFLITRYQTSQNSLLYRSYRSTAINVFARAVVRQHRIPFEIASPEADITREGAMIND